MTGLYTFPLHHNIIRDILKYFPKKVSKEWGGIQDIACVKEETADYLSGTNSFKFVFLDATVFITFLLKLLKIITTKKFTFY